VGIEATEDAHPEVKVAGTPARATALVFRLRRPPILLVLVCSQGLATSIGEEHELRIDAAPGPCGSGFEIVALKVDELYPPLVR
jgi:hypothetical protein